MEYGKFASAEELLKGYNQLEKSFTQKCQELSQLKSAAENTQQSASPNDGTSAEASPSGQAQSTTVDIACTVPRQNAAEGIAPDPIPTESQLQQYLENNPQVVSQLLQKRSEGLPTVMPGGGNVSMALPSRPKTIKEASLMAKELFK